MRRLETDEGLLRDHQTNGVSMDGTACIHKAEVADFHEAGGQDMLEEAADKLDSVEVGGVIV